MEFWIWRRTKEGYLWIFGFEEEEMINIYEFIDLQKKRDGYLWIYGFEELKG